MKPKNFTKILENLSLQINQLKSSKRTCEVIFLIFFPASSRLGQANRLGQARLGQQQARLGQQQARLGQQQARPGQQTRLEARLGQQDARKKMLSTNVQEDLYNFLCCECYIKMEKNAWTFSIRAIQPREHLLFQFLQKMIFDFEGSVNKIRSLFLSQQSCGYGLQLYVQKVLSNFHGITHFLEMARIL